MANNRKLGRATDHRMAMLRALVIFIRKIKTKHIGTTNNFYF